MSDSQSVLTDATLRPSTTAESSAFTSGSTSLPLVITNAYRDEQMRNKVQELPLLPSHRYKYSTWHDIQDTSLMGDELHAPRVREGPVEKEEIFYRLGNDTNHVHHGRRGRERRDYRDTTENWEKAEVCNLSYQHLAHSYQKENFLRILKRLNSVIELNLLEDDLTNLKSCSFPVCEELDLSRNFIDSFAKLPHIPRIKRLVLTNNDIQSLDGLNKLKNTPIEYLHLKGNPVSFSLNYRYRVFSILPHLLILDDIRHLPSDDEMDEDQATPTSCVVT